MKRSVGQSYKSYKVSVDEPVSSTDYINICNQYQEFLVEKVLDGHEVTLPARMGTLAVLGKKQEIKLDEDGNITGLAPDWVATKKLWEENPEARAQRKRIFHTNAHTDNTRYRFFWSKSRVLVENKTLYALRMSRANKRAVHKKIMEGTNYKTKL